MTLTEKHGLPIPAQCHNDIQLRDGSVFCLAADSRSVPLIIRSINLLGQAEREGWVELLRSMSKRDLVELYRSEIIAIADAIEAAIKGAG